MDKKVIRSTITLVNDRFDDDTNQIIAEGLRTICRVQFGGWCRDAARGDYYLWVALGCNA